MMAGRIGANLQVPAGEVGEVAAVGQRAVAFGAGAVGEGRGLGQLRGGFLRLGGDGANRQKEKDCQPSV